MSNRSTRALMSLRTNHSTLWSCSPVYVQQSSSYAESPDPDPLRTVSQNVWWSCSSHSLLCRRLRRALSVYHCISVRRWLRGKKCSLKLKYLKPRSILNPNEYWVPVRLVVPVVLVKNGLLGITHRMIYGSNLLNQIRKHWPRTTSNKQEWRHEITVLSKWKRDR